MAATAISTLLLAIGLFYLLTNVINIIAGVGLEKAVFQLLLGILLIIAGAVITFRKKLASVAERRFKSATDPKDNLKD